MDYTKSSNIQDRLSHNAVTRVSGEKAGFKATEFVKVMNIDDEPYSWDFCTEEDIAVQQGGLTATRTAKIEKFSLEPGQTTEMPGNIALVFIEGIVKHLIQKDGRAKMINIVLEQDKWVDRVFLGKKGVDLPYANISDPDSGSRSFRSAEMVKDPLDPFTTYEETAFPELTEEVIEEKPRRGRPAKATT